MAIEQVLPGSVTTFRETINSNFTQVLSSNGPTIDSPVITGTPIVPTASITNNSSTQIATTALTYMANSRCMYGTCATSGNVAAKVGVVDNFILQKGNRVGLVFTNSNTIASPTLNVNGTGAKNITCRGVTLTGSLIGIIPYGGTVAFFIYDGTQWILENPESITLIVTLNASSWSNSTISVSSNAILNDNEITLVPPSTITNEQLAALQQANIILDSQASGLLKIKAMGTVPTINIPVYFTINFSRGNFINTAGGGAGGASIASSYIVSTTAPANTNVLWIDNSPSYITGCVKFWNGNTWVPVVAVYGQ